MPKQVFRDLVSNPIQWFKHRELSLVIGLFLVVACVWVFAELSDEVFEGDTMTFDKAVLIKMRSDADMSDPIGPGWVEEMGRDLTALGGTAVLSLLTLSAVGFLILVNKKWLALVLLVATIGALAVSMILKHSFDRERPKLVSHGSNVYTKSFPSGHSMLAASTYLTLGVFLASIQKRRRLKTYILLIAIAITLLVGVSRVYLGVHWPTDVLAGWAAGAGWAMLCWVVARCLQKRHRAMV